MKAPVKKDVGPSQERHLKPVGHDVTTDAPARLERIATAAYFMAEARGFAPGYEMDDWLAAERAYEANHESSR